MNSRPPRPRPTSGCCTRATRWRLMRARRPSRSPPAMRAFTRSSSSHRACGSRRSAASRSRLSARRPTSSTSLPRPRSPPPARSSSLFLRPIAVARAIVSREPRSLRPRAVRRCASPGPMRARWCSGGLAMPGRSGPETHPRALRWRSSAATPRAPSPAATPVTRPRSRVDRHGRGQHGRRMGA